MATNELYTFSQTVSTTEFSITNDATGVVAKTDVGIFQCVLDLNALAAGDVFEWKAYEKTLTGDTQRVYASARFSGAQGEPNWVSPAFILIHGWDFSIVKISGTDRAITGSVRQA